MAHDESWSFEEQAILKLLRAAAERRAAGRGIDEIDYLIGVLEGDFPPFTEEELRQISHQPPRAFQEEN